MSHKRQIHSSLLEGFQRYAGKKVASDIANQTCIHAHAAREVSHVSSLAAAQQDEIARMQCFSCFWPTVYARLEISVECCRAQVSQPYSSVRCTRIST